jgi:hypothetical protein
MQDKKLMDFFKFDEADLEANRNGEYSEAQKKRLFKGLFAPKKYNFYKREGSISIQAYRTDPRSPANHHSLHVGEKQFDVKEDLLNIMTNGDVYAIYYCNAVQSDPQAIDSWDKILSVELISKAK